MFSRRPKFKFELTINELSNIPYTSGHCYLDIRVGDGSLSGLIAAISQLKLVPKSVSDSVDLGSSGTSQSSNSKGIHVYTSLRKIHNFKSSFNYKVSCNLRFNIKKRDTMIGDKLLTILVLYVPEKKSRSSKTTTELGRVRLNLAEYLNFTEPLSSKYLLQDSKVNSILSLTTYLEELPAEFDFHTLLHIEDSKHSNTPSSTSFPKSTKLSTRSFTVPQFQLTGVFGGLDRVINSQPSINGLKPTPPSDERSFNKSPSSKEIPKNGSQSDSDAPSFALHSFDNVIVDPLVSGLYKKVLESTWDPELQNLIKYTPEKIVEDIFNSKGSEYTEQTKSDINEFETMNENSDEYYKETNGLINEAKYREDLRSWKVSWT